MELVTGTGRSGTSALMRLLIELGEVPPCYFNESVSAGFELCTTEELGRSDLPPIVKNPRFFFEMDKVVQKVDVSHVYLCVRDTDQVIGSRLSKDALIWSEWGDIKGRGSNDAERMRSFIEQGYASFFSVVARENIPVTVLRYPFFLESFGAAWQQLRRSPLGLRYTKVDVWKAYREAIDTNLIHIYGGD